jgi:hypothetical protein
MKYAGRSSIEHGGAGATPAWQRGISVPRSLRATALVVALLSLAGLVSISVIPAGAAGGPEPLVEFCRTGVGAGQCTGPRGVATDPTSGHVYVAEVNNRRISEFTAWGEFVGAWGWNVAPDDAPGDTPSDQFEICTATCQGGSQATASSAGAGQFSNTLGVAVDSAGNVYVVDQVVRRVQKFNSAGEFVLMFGGDVNKTKVEEVGSTQEERNICTAASGHVCQAGTTGAAPGQFGAWKVASFIAIGPSDAVYVGDNDRIQVFNPDGTLSPGAEIALPGAGFVEALAIDPSGNLYVANEPSKVPGIRKLSASGVVLNHFATDRAPRALATDSNGNLYVVDGASNPVIRKYDTGGNEIASFGEGEFTTSTGIGTNPIGNVYVTNGTSANSYVRAYGPLPFAYGDPPEVPPTVVSQFAVSVDTTSAVVKAEINPHFFPTAYYVEYGTAPCSVVVCAQQPAAPGIALATERERSVPTSDVLLSALTPGTAYHYRFVAVSDAGTVPGPDRTFTTYQPGGFALPDGRAFEMVSPPEKNSGEVAVPGGPGGLVGLSVRPLQASATGEVIAYPSFTSFGDAQSAPAASRYMSRRGDAGWSTANITPPNQEGLTKDPFRGFSPDLSFSAVVQKEPKLDPDAVEGFENLYLRDNENGSFRALTTEPPRASGIYCASFAGASSGFDRVIFAATGALTPDAPEVPFPATNLYEWHAGELSLVSVLPDGTAAAPTNSTAFGAPGSNCEMNRSIVRNAISADGSRIFWTSGDQLLARLNGTETIQLDATQGGPGPAGAGRFWAASDDGSKVFFTSPNQLTPDASSAGSGDLYLYDFDAAPGEELTDISADPTPGTDPPNLRGVLGASEDGSRVYFVADGALAEGAVAGQPNLYVWQAGTGLRFIATLVQGDANLGNEWGLVRLSGASQVALGFFSGVPESQTARVTPDGRHLAFMSTASLTDHDNVSQDSGELVSQVYLYDAQEDELVCASCNPAKARPIGFSELPVWITPDEQPRYLSDDGGRLFFLSFDRLALRDTNDRQDVYEFEREGVGSCTDNSATFSSTSGGCLFLVSSGSSGDHSFFLDASADGRDVFISTRERLFPTDEDERYDVYDARVGGGFAPPALAPPICAGEACRPVPAAPSMSFPGSAGFAGDGNARPGSLPPCRRRQVRRGNRCVAKRKLAQRICRRKRGSAKQRCIRDQTKRLALIEEHQQRRVDADRGAAR